MKAALLIVLLSTSWAHALIVTPAKSNGDFISGSGIPGDDFTGATAGTGEQVFLKARSRDTGAASVSGNVYTVQTGSAADNINPWWSFDFQLTPGTSDTSTLLLQLEVDFDPAVGVSSFKSLAAPVLDADAVATNSWDDGDSYFVNPGGGAWTDNTTPFVVANSFHKAFAFWGAVGPSGMTYDRDVVGEYEIRLTAFSGATQLAQTSILVNAVAVPEASQVIMMGLVVCVCGLVAYKRRK